MTKFATGGDPAWASAFNNIAGMFDPKVEAEGAALRAKRASLESDARYNNARAIGAEDQNSALGEAYLASVGYTPQEIAAMRAARSGSVYDIAHGQNAFRGRTAMEAGNASLALPLLGQAAAFDDFMKGRGTETLMKDPVTGAFNYPLAAALAGGAHNVGGNLAELTPQGWVLRGPTEQGRVYQGQVVNNANESLANVGLTTAKTEGVRNLGVAKVETEEERQARISGQTENDRTLTTAKQSTEAARTQAVGQGANDRTTLTGAKVATEGVRQGVLQQGANDRTKVADERVNTESERGRRIANATENDNDLANAVIGLTNERTARVKAGTENDKAKSDTTVQTTKDKAAATVKSTQDKTEATVKAIEKKAEAGVGSAVDNANKQASLRQKIDKVFDTAYAKRTNNGKAWALLDPEQKKSIVDYATEAALDNNGNIVEAMREAESAHNATGGASEGVTKGWFSDKGNGVMSLNGFKPAKYQRRAKSNSPVADVVSGESGSAPAAPAKAAPATPADENVIEAKTQADIDNAPSGAIIIVNGRRMRKR